MDSKPKAEGNDVPMIPKFWAENTIAHLGFANRRMLTALITVCVTFILTIIIFVHGYTVREKNWLDAITMIDKPAASEVDNGILKQHDESAYP